MHVYILHTYIYIYIHMSTGLRTLSSRLSSSSPAVHLGTVPVLCTVREAALTLQKFLPGGSLRLITEAGEVLSGGWAEFWNWEEVDCKEDYSTQLLKFDCCTQGSNCFGVRSLESKCSNNQLTWEHVL